MKSKSNNKKTLYLLISNLIDIIQKHIDENISNFEYKSINSRKYKILTLLYKLINQLFFIIVNLIFYFTLLFIPIYISSILELNVFI